MADLSGQGVGKIYLKPAVMDYTNIGTVAGTTNLALESCWIDGIQITTWASAGKFILYDGGTNTNPIGTITQGTSPTNNPPFIQLGFRTIRGLTIANDTNFGGIVIWGK